MNLISSIRAPSMANTFTRLVMLNSLLATMDASQKQWEYTQAKKSTMLSIPMSAIRASSHVEYLSGTVSLRDGPQVKGPQNLKTLESQQDEMD